MIGVYFLTHHDESIRGNEVVPTQTCNRFSQCY